MRLTPLRSELWVLSTVPLDLVQDVLQLRDTELHDGAAHPHGIISFVRTNDTSGTRVGHGGAFQVNSQRPQAVRDGRTFRVKTVRSGRRR